MNSHNVFTKIFTLPLLLLYAGDDDTSDENQGVVNSRCYFLRVEVFRSDITFEFRLSWTYPLVKNLVY
jgi:hypothetical protein